MGRKYKRRSKEYLESLKNMTNSRVHTGLGMYTDRLKLIKRIEEAHAQEEREKQRKNIRPEG